MSYPLYQKPRWVDNNGNALVGGKVYIYDGGTTTPAPIFQDSGLSVAAANPIILNSRGEAATAIFLADGYIYREDVYDSNDALINTQDGLTAALTTGSTPFASGSETIAGASSVKAVTPAGGAAAYDRLATAAAHTAGKSTAQIVPTPSGGAITPNCALSNVFRQVLTAALTINNPTNPLSGQVIEFILKQDGTGGWAITWGTKYKFAAGSPTLVTTASARNKVVCAYDVTDDVWLCDIGPNYT